MILSHNISMSIFYLISIMLFLITHLLDHLLMNDISIFVVILCFISAEEKIGRSFIISTSLVGLLLCLLGCLGASCVMRKGWIVRYPTLL